MKYKKNYKLEKIAISSSSSWSLWIFRKAFLENLSKKYNLIILSKENLFLKKIKFYNNYYYLRHNINFYIKNFFFLKKNKIKKFVEYDIKNLIFHFFFKIFYDYKLIVICAGLGSFYNKKGYFNFTERLILWLIFRPVNKIIFINKYDNNILSKITNIKGYTIPTEGYDLKFSKIKKKLNKKISFVLGARPIKEKGIAEYIKAAEKFPSYNFYLYLIDSDKKKIFYNSKIFNFKKNLPKNLKIKKNIQNFKKKIEYHDCLISSSYGEGFGNTLADATCAGISVISTKTHGAKYIFRKKSLIWSDIKSSKSLTESIKFFLKLKNSQRIKMISEARKDLIKIKSENIIKKLNTLL